jgi:hypothetical protein
VTRALDGVVAATIGIDGVVARTIGNVVADVHVVEIRTAVHIDAVATIDIAVPMSVPMSVPRGVPVIWREHSLVLRSLILTDTLLETVRALVVN